MDLQNLWRTAAILFSFLAIGAAIAGCLIPAGERIDFDVTGFLLLITSLPKLFAWMMAIAFGGMAIRAWLHVIREG